MNAASAWADEVLALLRRGPTPRDQLAHDLALPRQAIDDALKELMARGYVVENHRQTGLALAAIPDLLLADEIEAAIAGLRLGSPLHTYGRVSSTNTVAGDLAAQGAPEGTLVTAEEQTRGRGRLGRSWDSPPGVGVWMSLVLRPPLDPERAAGLSLVAGLAVAAAIRLLARVEAVVKWPNDVMVRGKKIAGVLCESVLEGTTVRYTVMGIGINVNQERDQIPAPLQATADSVRLAAGHKISRIQLLAAVLREFEPRYDRYCRHGFGALREEYRAHSFLIGKPVTLSRTGAEIAGIAVDIAPDGSLLIATADRVERVHVGDASLRID